VSGIPRSITLVVLAGYTGQPRTLRLTRTAVIALALIAIAGGMGSVWLVRECGTLQTLVTAQRNAHARAEGWQDVQGRVEGLEGQMATVRGLSQSLQASLGITHAQRMRTAAHGGAGADARATLRTLMQEPGGLVAWATGEIAALDAEIERRGRAFRGLQIILDRRTALLAATPAILPAQGWISTRFGLRSSPFTGQREEHEGIDIAAPPGTAIHATAAGTVRFAGTLGSYGNVVVIDHGYGYRTLYAHNANQKVRVGQRVQRGDEIAGVGTTGRTTGPHVHYEVQVNGVPADPMRYVIDTPQAPLASLLDTRRRS
jgi:murein DD-endopeptidase MepM/ murein hydrolase activator NlpD